MSGVYIKNMQMPKHCWQCPFHDEADVCTRLGLSCMKVWGEEKTLPDCPLVPVETRDDAPWDLIADADFKNTNKVTFTTPHCGEVEFVKVVRCKDCKRYREGKVLSPQKFCFRLKDRDGEAIGYNFAEDDFCSYGERSEE